LALTFWCGQLASQSQYALSFDGVDDYATLGSDASLDIKGPITLRSGFIQMSIWFPTKDS
jgi:hypothetical protein